MSEVEEVVLALGGRVALDRENTFGRQLEPRQGRTEARPPARRPALAGDGVGGPIRSTEG